MHRLLFCLALALAVFIAKVIFKMEMLLAVMISLSGFSLFMILISWISFFTTSSEQNGLQAKVQDESRYVTFIIVLIAVAITFFGTLALIQNTGDGLMGRGLHIITSLMSLALSWCLLHTIYTLCYAHLYYTENFDSSKSQPRGLDFPENKTPNYLDFAYFAFVIGMTFQVSDVRITSPSIRRLVLLHRLISVVFNTSIVAVTINIIAGFIKSDIYSADSSAFFPFLTMSPF